MRRHLGFEAEEWRALAWWKTRLYLEGLEHEFVTLPAQQQAPEEQDELVPLEALGVRWS